MIKTILITILAVDYFVTVTGADPSGSPE